MRALLAVTLLKTIQELFVTEHKVTARDSVSDSDEA
jgi:hypothetical protein